MTQAERAFPCYTGTMTDDGVAARMCQVGTELLGHLDDEQRSLAWLPFADDASRRWLEYRPEPRPGACLALLPLPGRKAAFRLLATALSDRAFAQAMAIVALEEVLERFPNWELVPGGTVRQHTSTVRGYSQVQVRPGR